MLRLPRFYPFLYRIGDVIYLIKNILCHEWKLNRTVNSNIELNIFSSDDRFLLDRSNAD